MTKTSPSKDRCFETSAGPRARIFAVARDLFYRQGIRGVGVETIASEANATKMTLYRAFQSKDALVAECLKEAHREFTTWWDDCVAPHPDDPRAALLALFRGVEQKARTCQQRGCAIGNAAVELGEDSHPGRQVVMQHNAEKRARMLALTRRLGVTDPELLADGLTLMIKGSYVASQSFGPDGPQRRLVEAATVLIDCFPREVTPRAAERGLAAVAA